MIKTEHLSKKYRGKLAVDDVSFEVKTGRVTGFLGPNGAGKSTTMRLMLGLDNGSGKTIFDGKPLFAHEQPAKVAGVLLEAKAFHPTRTARHHLQVLAAQGNIPYSRVEEVLDIVGLKDVAKKKPGKFSLGMSQRLGIAAALLGEPKYLMLDEPANGLDPEGVAWLRKFLSEYADRGNAVFVSSHLLSEMQLMADDIIVIGKGKLLTSGSMEDLMAKNAHTSVFVRSSKLAKLEQALNKSKLIYKKTDGGLTVSGSTTDRVGKLSYEAGAPILELTSRSASLEQIFLDITEGSEEYATHKEGNKS